MKKISIALLALCFNSAFADETCPAGATVLDAINKSQTRISHWSIVAPMGNPVKNFVFIRTSTHRTPSDQLTTPSCYYIGLNNKNIPIMVLLNPYEIQNIKVTGQDWDAYGNQCGYPGPIQDPPEKDYPLTSCSFSVLSGSH